MFSTCHSNLAVTSCSAIKGGAFFIFRRSVWWFESWYNWRICYLLLNQFRLALVKERRCTPQAAGEAVGCTWGLSPCRAQESLKLLLLPSRLACARLCSVLAVGLAGVVSFLWCLCCPWQLYSVPVHMRSLARGSSGGDQRWAIACACVDWRGADPSFTSSVSLLKHEL